MNEQQVMTAVDWWASDLKNPAYKNRRPGNNSDSSDIDYVKEKGLAEMARPDRPSEDQIKDFKEALAHNLSERPNEPAVSTDYDPGPILSEALRIAGLDPSRGYLSVKTIMRFDCGGVQVAHGYGRDFEELLLDHKPAHFCDECGHPYIGHINQWAYDEELDRNTRHYYCVLCSCSFRTIDSPGITQREPTNQEQRLINKIRKLPEYPEWDPENGRSIEHIRESFQKEIQEYVEESLARSCKDIKENLDYIAEEV